MHAQKHLRFLFATVTCIGLMLLLAGPHLLFVLYVAPLFDGDDDSRRSRLFSWQADWSAALLRVFTGIMKISLTYDLPATSQSGNAIIIANHRSWLDIFLVAAATRQLGIDRLTAIVKRQIRKIPVLGRFAVAINCALITRRDKQHDLEAIRRCALDSKWDRASVVIFPEGTRYDGRSPRRRGFRQVLKPKSGGLDMLLETLPDYSLLSVTVKWPAGVRVRTITDGASLVGKSLTICIRQINRDQPAADAHRLLSAAWSEMDRSIAAN